jgi:hypothetical protein
MIRRGLLRNVNGGEQRLQIDVRKIVPVGNDAEQVFLFSVCRGLREIALRPHHHAHPHRRRIKLLLLALPGFLGRFDDIAGVGRQVESKAVWMICPGKRQVNGYAEGVAPSRA